MGKVCVKPLQRKGKWSDAEELTLSSLHRDMGNKWASISKHLPERTDSDVKNHWFSTLRSKSEAKMQTFLWIYAKKVESVSETREAREAVFDEVMADLSSLSSPEVLKMAAGLNKPAVFAEACVTPSKEDVKQPIGQLLSSICTPGMDTSYALDKSFDDDYLTAEQDPTDPNLLNGDISDDLMMKLIETGSEDEWFSPPSSTIKPSIPSAHREHSSHSIQLGMEEGGSESLSETLQLQKKRSSSTSPSAFNKSTDPEWNRPSKLQATMSAEPVLKLEVVDSASRRTSLDPLQMGHGDGCFSTSGNQDPATTAQPKIMYSLLMEHIKRHNSLGSCAAQERALTDIQRASCSNISTAVANLSAPVHLQRRRCTSHPFSNKFTGAGYGANLNKGSTGAQTNYSKFGHVSSSENLAMYSTNSGSTLDEDSSYPNYWAISEKPCGSESDAVDPSDPADLLFGSELTPFMSSTVDANMDLFQSYPEWIL